MAKDTQADNRDEPQQALLFVLFNEIGIINQLASARFERRLPDGLTLPQFSVLNNFVRLGGTRTPAQLADAFQVTRGAMTNTLKRLEARGCVRIEQDATDGRSKQVSLTRRGRSLRERAVRSLAGDLALVQDDLDARALVALLPQLQSLRAWLDSQRD